MPQGRLHSSVAPALALALVLIALAARPATARVLPPELAYPTTRYSFYIWNYCNRPVTAAVYYDKPGHLWQVSSWYQIRAGSFAGPFRTNSRKFGYYAQTISSPTLTWGGSTSCTDCYYGTRGGRSYPFRFASTYEDSTPNQPYTAGITC